MVRRYFEVGNSWSGPADAVTCNPGDQKRHFYSSSDSSMMGPLFIDERCRPLTPSKRRLYTGPDNLFGPLPTETATEDGRRTPGRRHISDPSVESKEHLLANNNSGDGSRTPGSNAGRRHFSNPPTGPFDPVEMAPVAPQLIPGRPATRSQSPGQAPRERAHSNGGSASSAAGIRSSTPGRQRRRFLGGDQVNVLLGGYCVNECQEGSRRERPTSGRMHFNPEQRPFIQEQVGCTAVKVKTPLYNPVTGQENCPKPRP